MNREFFEKHYKRLEQIVLNNLLYGEKFSLEGEDEKSIKEVARFIAKAALEGEFEILYEPQVNFDGTVKSAQSLASQLIEGIEVDARVLAFIARTNKFEKQLNRLIMHKLCTEMPDILKALGKDYAVIHQMNPQLFSDEFCQEYCELLLSQKLRPENMPLAFSESASFKNLSPELMLKLKSLGTKFILNDVGLGRGSSSIVTDFPFDEIKIAKEIVQGVDKSDINQQFIEDVAQTHHRDAEITVSGVQTKEEHDTIQNLSYTAIDGYVYSNAFAKDELIEKSTSKSHTTMGK